MTPDEADAFRAEVLGSVPVGCDRLIVIYPADDGQTAVRWFGMSAEQAATVLYQMADGIVEQRVPPPDWTRRVGRD